MGGGAIVMSDGGVVGQNFIIDADSSFGGAAGGAALRVTGASAPLAPAGPPLEPPLQVVPDIFERMGFIVFNVNTFFMWNGQVDFF